MFRVKGDCILKLSSITYALFRYVNRTNFIHYAGSQTGVGTYKAIPIIEPP